MPPPPSRSSASSFIGIGSGTANEHDMVVLIQRPHPFSKQQLRQLHLPQSLRKQCGGCGGGSVPKTSPSSPPFGPLLNRWSRGHRLRCQAACLALLAGAALWGSVSSCRTLRSFMGLGRFSLYYLPQDASQRSYQQQQQSLQQQNRRPPSSASSFQNTAYPFNASAPPLHTVPIYSLHAHYPAVCDDNLVMGQRGQTRDWRMHPSVPSYVDLARNNEENHTRKHHLPYTAAGGHSWGSITYGPLTRLQGCTYSLLDDWWSLARTYNITNWSAHGGSAIGARCWGSLNPWDDDIDVSVWNCSTSLDRLWDEGRNVSEVYPDLDLLEYSVDRPNQVFEPRLVGNNWILLKGSRCCNWYKLKSVGQVRHRIKAGSDISGMDIECMEKPTYENEVRQIAGWDEHMSQGKPLDTVMFGPTSIQVVPQPLLDDYIRFRYGKSDPCSYPFRSGQDRNPHLLSVPRQQDDQGRRRPVQPLPTGADPRLRYWPDVVRHSLHWVMAHWYTNKKQRDSWRLLAERNMLSDADWIRFLPRFNDVEVDNSIAPPGGSCWAPDSTTAAASNRSSTLIHVATFDAQRGTFWDRWADLVQTHPNLRQATVLVVRNLDVGMARSGNVHAARRLALQLGMNYAFALESLELTRGTIEEQEVTRGQRDALGLHGHAVLSRCQLADPWVVREPFPADHQALPTGERRVGGNVGLLVRLTTEHDYRAGSDRIVVGNLPRLFQASGAVDAVRNYIGTSQQAVISGDPDSDACTEWQLWPLVPNDATSPGCGVFRSPRLQAHGTCSNLRAVHQHTIAPCHGERMLVGGGGLTLSDRAVTVMALSSVG